MKAELNLSSAMQCLHMTGRRTHIRSPSQVPKNEPQINTHRHKMSLKPIEYYKITRIQELVKKQNESRHTRMSAKIMCTCSYRPSSSSHQIRNQRRKRWLHIRETYSAVGRRTRVVCQEYIGHPWITILRSIKICMTSVLVLAGIALSSRLILSIG